MKIFNTVLLLMLTASINVHASRISVMIDSGKQIDNMDEITIILPDGQRIALPSVLSDNQRISVKEDFRPFKEGDTFGFELTSIYGGEKQTGSCGTLKLDKAMEAVRLTFQLIPGRSPKSDPPWFNCSMTSSSRK